ncbi:MAG TPA: chloride channel protein [Stellaceae bacterium]|nr:chloride channel protein [Stellaceae bacterium]
MEHERTDYLRDFSTDARVLFLVGLALVIGAAGAGAAAVLLWLIELITNVAYTGQLDGGLATPAGNHLGAFALFVPAAGGLIIGFMARFGSEKIRGHGIPEAIEAILIGGSRIQPKVALLKPISSAISIGTGGPFGAEGPIIMTGGALGSLIAQFFELSSAERKTLLVAGAAAGMSATFATPVAAVLIAVELLLFEWKPRSFIPVAAASTVAAALRPFLIGAGPLFPVTAHLALPWWGLLACVASGIVAGLASGLLTALVYGSEDLFQRLPIHWMWWPVLGGLIVGLGGLIEPRALGVGYDIIREMLQHGIVLKALLVLLVVKAVIWAVALGSGTSGGVLAPLLIIGGALGALEAPLMPVGDSRFWAMLGMAAMMGGTMRSPLTALVFTLELTHDTGALLPLLIACSSAFAVTVLLLKRSILTEKLARRGQHVNREYVVDPFEIARVGDVMVRKVDTLPARMRIEDAVRTFTEEAKRHKSYPILTEDGRVLGMASRADALRWLMRGWEPGTTLADVARDSAPLVGHADELVGQLADRMAAQDIGRVPIVDRQRGTLVGIVSRKDLLQVRAHMRAQERERQPLLRLARSGERPARRD